MAFSHNPRIVTDGLVLCVDPSDKNCYGGSGTTATDLSTQGNNVTFTDANVGTTTSGVFSFDSSEYCTFTDGADFTFGTNPFAIEQWLNFTDFSPDDDVWNCPFQIYRVEGDRHGFMVFYNNGSDFEWRLESSANGFYPPIVVLTDNGVTLNKWHHIAVSRQSEAVFKQYIDGKLVQTVTAGNGDNAGRGDTYNTNWALIDGTGYIGNYAAGDLHEFEGKMGPTRVYKNRALSDAEIVNNFNAQRASFGV